MECPELLSYGVADGRRSVLCLYWSCDIDHLAGDRFWRFGFTAEGAYLFCLLPRGPAVRRRIRSFFYDSLHRAARKAALQSAWFARGERKLDGRWWPPHAHRGTLCKICRLGLCGGKGNAVTGGKASATGLRANVHRRISSGGMGLLRDGSACRIAAKVAAWLPRAQRGPCGGKSMKAF